MLRYLSSRLAGFLDHLGDFRNFQRPFLVLLAIYSTFYLSALASFSLSIDDELAATRENAAVWLAQGRWLTYLVEQLLVSQPVLPFFPLFTFGALVSAGYMLLVGAHGYKADDRLAFLTFCVFCAFPTLFFILGFAGNTIGLGVGLALTCVGLCLFNRAALAYASGEMSRRDCVSLFAMQAGLGAAAVGAYQSLILLVAAGCCGIFIIQYVRRPAVPLREIVAVHLYLGCVVLASVILSLLVSRGLQLALGVEPKYIERFLQIDLLSQNPWYVIKRAVSQYVEIYGGATAVYGFPYYTFPVSILLGAWSLLACVPAARPARMVFACVYLFGITTIPFVLNIASGGVMPYRALIAVPYVFWFFTAGAVFSHIKAIRRVAVILIIVMIVQCLYTFSLFQSAKQLAFERDTQLASQVYARIAAEAPDFDRSRIYHADFYGAYEFETVYPHIWSSTLGASFFEWDGGNPYRIVAFMKVIGLSNIEALDNERRKAFLPVLQGMPIWPQQGSVKINGDVVLVRLGEKPGRAHKDVMGSPN